MSRKAKALEFANAEYNIQITGRHVQVTDAMKDYAMDKVSKIERFTDRIIDVNVIMDIQKLEHRAEFILKVGHTKITSQASTDDMYVSIDCAVNKLETQLQRYKKKLQNHHAKSLSVVDLNVNIVRPLSDEEWEEFEEANQDNADKFPRHDIVKQESMPMKMLTQHEAIMKMELSGDTFLIYKSEEDQRLKVIYRRKDGNYGIIEPQT